MSTANPLCLSLRVISQLAGKSQRALLLLASDGADYAINLAVFANISAGTSFQIPQGAMETLSMYLLDGQQYMVHAAADAHGNGTCESDHLNFPHHAPA